MEALLPRCLDSLVHTSKPELLEAIVVNDGSKDSSLAIARQYESRYPEIVTIIDKPNGNYGSTINAALPVAKGQYVRILDSDDWYNTEALNSFISALQEQKCDMVITHFTQLEPDNRKEVVKYNSMGREPYEYGRVYDLDDVLKDNYIRSFFMHALTYRTQLLRDMNYRQTEGISYTDTEFDAYPVFYAKTIMFLDLNVYQYNMDRVGQTMDPAVIMKSIDQFERLYDIMFKYYEDFDWTQVSEIRKSFLKKYFEHRIRLLYKLFLLDMPRQDFNTDKFESVFKKYSLFMTNHEMHVDLYPENKILHFDYVKYWKRRHQRWPRWFECFNGFVDYIVKGLYVKLFRQ